MTNGAVFTHWLPFQYHIGRFPLKWKEFTAPCLYRGDSLLEDLTNSEKKIGTPPAALNIRTGTPE